MNGINPVGIDKTADYFNNLQESFKERINTKEELGSMLPNSLGDGDAVKVEISSKGLEMSEEVKRGEMPKGAIRQLEREPLTKEQLRSVPSGRFGEDILSKMQRVDPKAFEEYEKIRERRKTEATDKNVKDEARFVTQWAMRDELPKLSCWEDIDKREKETKELEQQLRQVDAELAQKNNDAYRRHNAVVS